MHPWRLAAGPRELKVSFSYEIEPEIRFSSAFTFSFPDDLPLTDERALEPFLSALAAVDALSYWKCCCPPTIEFSGALAAPDWWRKLYYNGLSEFRYLNGIEIGAEEFVELHCAAPDGQVAAPGALSGNLIPVGGGKDSAVTLEILKPLHAHNTAFILNPLPAALRTAECAGYPPEAQIRVTRPIDPALLELNAAGYLNGHTPFSALLAFSAALAAAVSRRKNIILSNEASANEGNIRGSDVNHQYSKTFAFEKLVADYISTNLHPEMRYFSLLRPLNELQIAQRFARCKHQFSAFRSCNAGSSNDAWCGKCSKCLFVYICLSPFLSSERLAKIFGRNLLADPELEPLLLQLAGIQGIKPFECVGTHEEVCAALNEIAEQYQTQAPRLVKTFLKRNSSDAKSIEALLAARNDQHLVPPAFLKLLQLPAVR